MLGLHREKQQEIIIIILVRIKAEDCGLVGGVTLSFPLGHAPPFLSANRGLRQSKRGRTHTGQRLVDGAGQWEGLGAAWVLHLLLVSKKKKKEKGKRC